MRKKILAIIFSFFHLILKDAFLLKKSVWSFWSSLSHHHHYHQLCWNFNYIYSGWGNFLRSPNSLASCFSFLLCLLSLSPAKKKNLEYDHRLDWWSRKWPIFNLIWQIKISIKLRCLFDLLPKIERSIQNLVTLFFRSRNNNTSFPSFLMLLLLCKTKWSK